MRTLITTALIGGVLALAVTPVLAQTAASAPLTAALPSSATRAPATSMAPAALTAVRVKLVSDRGIFYPRAALARGTIGCVRLRLFLGAAGHPLVISDVDSHPPGVFDAAALGAATTFRYRITDSAGHAIPAGAIPDVSVEQSLMYVLSEEEDQADAAREWVCSLPPPAR